MNDPKYTELIVADNLLKLLNDGLNLRRREQNAILRDLCGTSARAAREDMGL